MPKLLLVEDDLEFALVLETVLENNRYTVDHVTSGSDAADRIQHYDYDVVLLDWQLPDFSGLEVCKLVRKSGSRVPILMLTALDSIKSKVSGLDEGADDYLTKPCDMQELLARLRVLVRRGQNTGPAGLAVGSLRIEPATHMVYLNDQQISLSRTEFSLLEFLMRHKGEVFDSDALLARVWSSESEVSKDLVKVYVNKLRNKLKSEDGQAPVIVTVHGVGYKLDEPRT